MDSVSNNAFILESLPQLGHVGRGVSPFDPKLTGTLRSPFPLLTPPLPMCLVPRLVQVANRLFDQPLRLELDVFGVEGERGAPATTTQPPKATRATVVSASGGEQRDG